MLQCLSPVKTAQVSQYKNMSANSITSTADTHHDLRKRHAIDKNGKENNVKNEILSAEMLAPLPQANISRVSSTIDHDDETEALLEVKNEVYAHLLIY